MRNATRVDLTDDDRILPCTRQRSVDDHQMRHLIPENLGVLMAAPVGAWHRDVQARAIASRRSLDYATDTARTLSVCRPVRERL
jgi:hypothetical protein